MIKNKIYMLTLFITLLCIFMFSISVQAEKQYQLLGQGGNALLKGTLKSVGLDFQDPNGQFSSTFTSDIDGGAFSKLYYSVIDDNESDTLYGFYSTFIIANNDASNDTLYCNYLNMINSDTDTGGTGYYIVNNDAGTGPMTAGLRISNLQSTGINITDGIKIDASYDGTIVDAIDVSDAEITNAINVGANVILGTTPTINFTYFDLDSEGNLKLGAPLSSDLYYWVEEFDDEAAAVELGSSLIADFWTVSGTNDAAAMYVYTAGAGGTLDISSDTAADDSSAISGVGIFRVDNDPIMEVRFKVTDVSNCYAAIGFAEGSFDDKGTVDDDVCLIYIDYDSADTTPDLSWNVWCADTNVDVSGDLGVDATSDTYITAKIDLTNTEQPRIWIDGSEISASLILGTVQAGTTLFPYAHVQTNYTAAKKIVIDYMKGWQDR